MKTMRWDLVLAILAAVAVTQLPCAAVAQQPAPNIQEFPPQQKPGSFSVDQAMQMLMNQKGGD
jgi:hypothetical protein